MFLTTTCFGSDMLTGSGAADCADCFLTGFAMLPASSAGPKAAGCTAAPSLTGGNAVGAALTVDVTVAGWCLMGTRMVEAVSAAEW